MNSAPCVCLIFRICNDGIGSGSRWPICLKFLLPALFVLSFCCGTHTNTAQKCPNHPFEPNKKGTFFFIRVYCDHPHVANQLETIVSTILLFAVKCLRVLLLASLLQQATTHNVIRLVHQLRLDYDIAHHVACTLALASFLKYNMATNSTHSTNTTNSTNSIHSTVSVMSTA